MAERNWKPFKREAAWFRRLFADMPGLTGVIFDATLLGDLYHVYGVNADYAKFKAAMIRRKRLRYDHQMESSKLANPVRRAAGKAEWTHMPGDKYLVTGVDRSGKRFRQVWDSWQQASGINLWCGTKWLLRDGKKHKISTTTN